MSRSLTIEEDNLLVAWAKAFLHVVNEGEISPLTVVIRGFDSGEPREVASIRQLLDDALGADKKALSCHEVANTIFPNSMWNPRADRQKLYERYRRIMPCVLRNRRNRYGVYFQRLIAYDHDIVYEGGINQLEHIIQTWDGGNHRRTALQAAIFDPRKDHTNQRMRGFPCLQQVAFAPQGVDGPDDDRVLRYAVHLRACVRQLSRVVLAGPIHGPGDGKATDPGDLRGESGNARRQDEGLP